MGLLEYSAVPFEIRHTEVAYARKELKQAPFFSGGGGGGGI